MIYNGSLLHKQSDKSIQFQKAQSHCELAVKQNNIQLNLKLFLSERHRVRVRQFQPEHAFEIGN